MLTQAHLKVHARGRIVGNAGVTLRRVFLADPFTIYLSFSRSRSVVDSKAGRGPKPSLLRWNKRGVSFWRIIAQTITRSVGGLKTLELVRGWSRPAAARVKNAS